jgi:hypothetical protein
MEENRRGGDKRRKLQAQVDCVYHYYDVLKINKGER